MVFLDLPLRFRVQLADCLDTLSAMHIQLAVRRYSSTIRTATNLVSLSTVRVDEKELVACGAHDLVLGVNVDVLGSAFPGCKYLEYIAVRGNADSSQMTNEPI